MTNYIDKYDNEVYADSLQSVPVQIDLNLIQRFILIWANRSFSISIPDSISKMIDCRSADNVC